MAQYGKPEYWEERYSKDPEPFDWYQRYAALRDLVSAHVPKAGAVLVPGCGNSTLSEDMVDDGFVGGIANIDISRTVIDAQAERLKDRKGLTWQVMNCCALSFPDGAFDAVLDKGTLDSLLCGENTTANASRYLHEVARVMKPSGVLMVVSYGSPENRLSYLEGDFGWSVAVHTLPKPTINAAGLPEASNDPTQLHYIYICRKQ